MTIRTKITLYLGTFAFASVIALFGLNYTLILRSLTQNAHLELLESEKNMQRAAETLLNTAIKNYLRGITEANLSYIQSQYDSYSKGKLSEKEAKNNIQEHFNLQKVGASGYLSAVEKRKGELYLDLHPYSPQQQCTDTSGCQQWYNQSTGYTEYEWQNPNDDSSRKKAAYVQEFSPWNWVVGASSYRDEFVDLVSITDLQDLISSAKIKKNGHFFIFSDGGKVLIHPNLHTADIKEQHTIDGINIFFLLLENKDQFVTYTWKDPLDGKKKKRYAVMEKLEPYNVYLVGSGSLDEIYEPIVFLKNITLIIAILAGALLLFLIYRLSDTITQPLRLFKIGIDRFYKEKTPFRWQKSSIVEIDALAEVFVTMSGELNQSMESFHLINQQLDSAEIQNESSRTLLESILNSMPSVLIGVSHDLVVNLWNDKAEQITGATQNFARQQFLVDVFPQLSNHLATIKTSIETNSTSTHFYSIVDADGRKNYSEMTTYPLHILGKKGALIRIDEVTKRIEMEQHLRQSQKMDAVGQLAGGISHDFNNMLGGIVGAAELLRGKVKKEEQGLVQIVSTAAERAGELIQKLLSFSRKENVTLQPVDVHSVVSDTIEILSRTLDKKIEIKSHLAARSNMVMGDRSELQNSLLNIGINAGHAMPTGGTLSFTTSTVYLDELYCESSSFELTPGTFLQVLIRDEGCGIAEKHLANVFEPFFTTKKENRGTGLGLAAVQSAMQQHNGAVTVYSEENVGSEFIIVLPVYKGNSEVKESTESLPEGKGCILIVDDEPVIRTTVRLMLKRLGYTTIEAENGLLGVDVYEEQQDEIDLVLLDMLMPVMDGTECFRKLKEIDADVRVIISSGFTREADLDELKKEGMLGFIRKPFSLLELGQGVKQALEQD